MGEEESDNDVVYIYMYNTHTFVTVFCNMSSTHERICSRSASRSSNTLNSCNTGGVKGVVTRPDRQTNKYLQDGMICW